MSKVNQTKGKTNLDFFLKNFPLIKAIVFDSHIIYRSKKGRMSMRRAEDFIEKNSLESLIVEDGLQNGLNNHFIVREVAA